MNKMKNVKKRQCIKQEKMIVADDTLGGNEEIDRLIIL